MKQNVWLNWPVVMASGILSGLLSSCTAYVQSPPIGQPVQVYVATPPAAYVVVTPPPPVYIPAQVVLPERVIEIHVASDFYEPLQAYGRWLDVPGYGRCWMPAGVDPDWRPYTDGHWQRTDAGWYWVSDERWGWATCHYGRWHHDNTFGWVWSPQTKWAPAWVAWRTGGGYTGWAPLPPEVGIGQDGTFQNQTKKIDPQSYVFVENKRMLEPQRHQNIIVNNTTIINNTVNITKIVVVNKSVINAGPTVDSVAQATGRKIDVVSVRNLRTRQEAPVIAESHQHSSEVPRAGVVPGLPAPAQHQPVTVQARVPVPSLVSTAAQIRTPATTSPPNRLEKPQTQNVPPTIKPDKALLTPQQKLELEKRKMEAKQRLEKAHSGSSTNSPTPPH